MEDILCPPPLSSSSVQILSPSPEEDSSDILSLSSSYVQMRSPGGQRRRMEGRGGWSPPQEDGGPLSSGWMSEEVCPTPLSEEGDGGQRSSVLFRGVLLPCPHHLYSCSVLLICPPPLTSSSALLLCPPPLNSCSVLLLCPPPLSSSSIIFLSPPPLSYSHVLLLCPPPLEEDRGGEHGSRTGEGERGR